MKPVEGYTAACKVWLFDLLGVSETCRARVVVGLVWMEMPFSLLLPICKGMDGSNGSIYIGCYPDDTHLLLSHCAECPLPEQQKCICFPRFCWLRQQKGQRSSKRSLCGLCLKLCTVPINKWTECKGRGGKKETGEKRL